MRLTRPAVSLAATAVAAALLLAGCGGGEGGGSQSDKIEGADDSGKGGKSPSPSKKGKDSPGDFRTSDIKLPDDVKQVFDWEQPSDPDKAAALDGAADYMRAMMHAMAEQDPKDPLLSAHAVPLGDAQEYASYIAGEGKKRGFTVTGTERYYKEQLGELTKKGLIEVDYCVDQAKLFSKKAKTGKVLRTSPSDESYLHFELVMQKPSKSGGSWKARAVTVTEKAVKQCGK
ncbi:hypothetical protein ITI46_33310 [Streptomyces oryzae]|uniref:Lipoprotein n=1 Tax=Streptomyces oryzae TaxID=1434886 RepID=A0ABS3XM54_9ACTN|nr:hypothetical protein [Streptomyces oryzae]MBO8196475.1 hypothetical protein [Streptomyces oryzae]